MQNPLPKLPVPKLRDTLSKYLLCIKPIVSSEDYETACQLVEDFIRPESTGETLQRHLEEFAESTDNWVRSSQSNEEAEVAWLKAT